MSGRNEILSYGIDWHRYCMVSPESCLLVDPKNYLIGYSIPLFYSQYANKKYMLLFAVSTMYWRFFVSMICFCISN